MQKRLTSSKKSSEKSGSDPSTDFIKYRQRLFFSIDIVGSTAFKARSSRPKEQVSSQQYHGQPWLGAFAIFFNGIETALEKQWSLALKELSPKQRKLIKGRPAYWKAAGDEVIYVIEISAAFEIIFSLVTFAETVAAFRAQLQTIDPSLNLKATGWMAGFPVINTEIVLGRIESSKFFSSDDDDWYFVHNYRLSEYYKSGHKIGQLDFLGPQMDLGFRLADKATPRKFIISADLAWFITDTICRENDNLPGKYGLQDRIWFGGTEPLRGIAHGIPYPIIWIDNELTQPLHKRHDDVMGRHAPDCIKVRDYCAQFFKSEFSDWLVKPFIIGDRNYDAAPQSFSEQLEASKKRFAMALEFRTSEMRAFQNPKVSSRKKRRINSSTTAQSLWSKRQVLLSPEANLADFNSIDKVKTTASKRPKS